MKKQNQRPKKKKRTKKKVPTAKKTQVVNSIEKSAQKELVQQKPAWTGAKKVPEKKAAEDRSIGKYVSKAGQFFREARMELKKVKWPTRKELLASTAVVIVLTLIIAFFLGLVDFGLVKIIKNIVG
ncbi:MAG: preprotein translocase subunit SecE [Desulfobacteraceae bacterium]|nr:MAG: preprotein translocase subunit SecE [Desulfobacteraceae bacterium]